MKIKALAMAIASLMLTSPMHAAAISDDQLQANVERLLARTQQLEHEVDVLKRQLHHTTRKTAVHSHAIVKKTGENNKEKTISYVSQPVTVHALTDKPEHTRFYPTALMAGDNVLTFFAGMPVVTSPYTGERPAFDGSSLIVNISSINQDLRLLEQRGAVNHAFDKLGYPHPDVPIIALSGKVEPILYGDRSYFGTTTDDLGLGGAELDVMAMMNPWVEGFLSLAYDDTPPLIGGQTVANSNLYLNKGFVNIGNLDKTPFYMTAGQLYVPFGRFSSNMISSSLPQLVGRTKARPVILGYKQQHGPGLYAAIYGFKSDTTLGDRGVGGANVGYTFHTESFIGDIGASVISNIADAGGMQAVGGAPGTFTGFGTTAMTEAVSKVPAFDAHLGLSIDAYNFIAEWVTATSAFRPMDMSYNTLGAKPQAVNLEAAYTFKLFTLPSAVAIGYAWTAQALALKLPKERFVAVLNTTIWQDTVLSFEYRHDIDYGAGTTAAGIGATVPTFGTGGTSDTVTAQFGFYF